MSNRKPKFPSELITESYKCAIGPSPVNKVSSNEYRIRQNESLKKSSKIANKNSSRDLRITSSIDNYYKTKEVHSEKHKKFNDIRISCNNLPDPNHSLAENMLEKDKYLRVKNLKNNFHVKIEKKLESIQKFLNSGAICEYFEIFDEIIKRDILFGSYLKRIRAGLRDWYDKNEGLLEYCSFLEDKLNKQQSLINKHFISNRHEISKSAEPDEILSFSNTLSSSIPAYKFIPLNQYSDPDCVEKLKITVKDLEARNAEYQKIVEDLENSQKAFVVKEQKFNLLLKALHDRGYPIEEIYSKDVLSIKSNSSDTTLKKSILEDHIPLSLSSSLMSIPNS